MPVRLIPLFRPDAIVAGFEALAEDLEAMLDNYTLNDLTQVLNEALAGKILIWLGFVDNKYAGFLITRIAVSQTNPPTKHLWLEQAFKKKKLGANSDIFGECLVQVEQWAKAQGCTCAHITSARKGYERFIRKYGYYPKTVEYTKEI